MYVVERLAEKVGQRRRVKGTMTFSSSSHCSGVLHGTLCLTRALHIVLHISTLGCVLVSGSAYQTGSSYFNEQLAKDLLPNRDFILRANE